MQSDARVQVTRFDGDATEAWLVTGALAVRPFGRSRVEVSAGRRASREVLTGTESDVDWIGADADLSFGRRRYLLLSGEQNRGDFGAGGTVYISLSWQL